MSCLTERTASPSFILALVAVVLYLALLVFDYKQCAQTTCQGELKPVFLVRELECLCVGKKEK